MWVRTIKKKDGSINDLNSYRDIFIGSIVTLIFEKLLNFRIIQYLEQNVAKFQTGDMRGKGVTDNLFILRGIIDHSKYLRKELWISFYDIEKSFDSLWLETCINSLWNYGVQNDILYLIYLLNRNTDITVKTPFGDTEAFTIPDLVKQGTGLGPTLNNCSLGEISDNGQNYQYREVNPARIC